MGRPVEQAARRSQDRPRLLHGHRARPVRADLRVHLQAGLLPPRRPRGDRKAARPRPRIVDRDQRRSQPRSSRKIRSTASITTSAKRRCRTCWRCALPTSCSSRSGTRPISTTCRSPWPRSVGAGTRGYYDESGALRDMVQNHMAQLLCLVAMEPPASDDANALRDEKLKVLRSLKPIAGADVGQGHRARPVPQRLDRRRRSVPSYQDELPADTQGLAHRDLRRAQGRDRELALGWSAVLLPHRQAPGRAASPRSSSSSATSRTRSSITPKARRGPTG